jgi:hypothetical protein
MGEPVARARFGGRIVNVVDVLPRKSSANIPMPGAAESVVAVVYGVLSSIA